MDPVEIHNFNHSTQTQRQNVTNRYRIACCTVRQMTFMLAALMVVTLQPIGFLFQLERRKYQMETVMGLRTFSDNATELHSNVFFVFNSSKPATLPVLSALDRINPSSGCNMTRWVYPTSYDQGKRTNDCFNVDVNRHLISNKTAMLKHHDTIYVTVKRLPEFVLEVLPRISVDVVLITGQNNLFHPINRPIEPVVIRTVLGHPHIVYWFCHNLDYYLLPHVNISDPKIQDRISPFPYGLMKQNWRGDYTDQPLKVYNQVYEQNQSNGRKAGSIYWGPIGGTNEMRKQLPGYGRKLTAHDLFENMAKHQFVVSPVGDRTECFRHYEALGLGAIPIILANTFSNHTSFVKTRMTLLHLMPGPVLLIPAGRELQQQEKTGQKVNWTDFVEGHVKKYLERYPQPTIPVRSEMLDVSYWVDYVENAVGHRLHWSWNP